jgi:Domain of unknown function (DUF4407)
MRETSTPPLSERLPASANGSGADLGSAIGLPEASIAALSLNFRHKAKPGRGLGRWLRILTGVDEDLLDRVWEERARYTGLGAIVLGTAIMATLSMLDALDQVFGPIWPALLVVALFWGLFVCAIDRWLLSSTHGLLHSAWSMWRIFLPRICLALLFGVIIATPLVLTVFGTEIVAQAQSSQQTVVTTYESELTKCNPLPGQATPKSLNCAHLRISVSDPVVGTNRALAFEKAQRQQLTNTVSADNKTIASLNFTARKECNGAHGSGLSGIFGPGPNCRRDRAQADAFVAQSHINQLEAQLTSLNYEINQQALTAGNQTQTYATAITTEIGKLVAAKKAAQGRIGLLNRIDALGVLMARSPVIAIATVLLGLFIVTVDCLPVLSKMMSGKTTYDQLLTRRLEIAGNIAAAGLKVNEREATGNDEIALERIEREVRARLEELDDASRFEKAKRDAELDRRTAELAAEFRRLAEEESA